MATTGFAIATGIDRLVLNVKDDDRFSRKTSWIDYWESFENTTDDEAQVKRRIKIPRILMFVSVATGRRKFGLPRYYACARKARLHTEAEH